MLEIVGGVIRYRDLVAKIKIAKNFFPDMLVIRENLCSRKFPAVRYSLRTLCTLSVYNSCIPSVKGELLVYQSFIPAVYNHWTGQVDWTGGLTLKITFYASNEIHMPTA